MKPINLHPHEVRAALAGNLGLIVRPVKDSVDFLGAGGSAGPEWNDPNCWGWEDPENPCHFLVLGRNPTQSNETPIRSPFGQPGDKLWGRETFRFDFDIRIESDKLTRSTWQLAYGADEPELRKVNWRPSTQMPRWASRITLEIATLAVKQVAKITEAKAMACGFGSYSPAYVSGGEICGADGVRPSDEFDDWYRKQYGDAQWAWFASVKGAE